MFKKPIQVAYGIRVVAFWMLIPFVVMFITCEAYEFKNHMTTQDVVLLEESYSMYPEEYSSFYTDINGKKSGVHAPVDSKVGDTITVILRNGEYYMTAKDDQTIKDYATVPGRFLRIFRTIFGNSIFGIHMIGLALVCLITFLISLKKTKDVKKEYPKLSMVTNIAGIVCSVIMSAALINAVVSNDLTGLAFGVLSLILGIIFTAVFVFIWVFTWALYAFAL